MRQNLGSSLCTFIFLLSVLPSENHYTVCGALWQDFFDDDELGIKKLFLARPVVFGRALEEYGFDSDLVIVVDPAVYFENDLSKLKERVHEVGIVTSTHLTLVNGVREEKKIKDWVNPEMIESFKVRVGPDESECVLLVS